MKNKKNIVISLVIFFVVVVLIVLFIIFNDRKLKEKIEDNNKIKDYLYGEEVILSKLSNVNGWYGKGDVQDFSKWNVIRDEDDYVVLYSSTIWGKVSNLSDIIERIYKLFSKYEIDLGENSIVRGLDETDLILLGCSVDNLSCSNSPDWAGYGLTSVKVNGSNVVFYGNTDLGEDDKYKLKIMEVNDVLVPFRPVVKILKTSIK